MNDASYVGELEKSINYHFKNTGLLLRALTHRSYVHEKHHSEREDNETLEFLGDAVLSLTISHLLLETYPQYKEGDLSRIRSSIVNERELANVATEINLGSHLLLGKGEEMTRGRRKPSLLADCLEALLAAVYLDGGLEASIEVVNTLFHHYLNSAEPEHPLKSLDKDFKTQLQEFSQAQYKLTPTYIMEREEGPDHDKTFYVVVALGGRIVARGSGKSKKEAQQVGAHLALEKLISERDEHHARNAND